MASYGLHGTRDCFYSRLSCRHVNYGRNWPIISRNNNVCQMTPYRVQDLMVHVTRFHKGSPILDPPITGVFRWDHQYVQRFRPYHQQHTLFDRFLRLFFGLSEWIEDALSFEGYSSFNGAELSSPMAPPPSVSWLWLLSMFPTEKSVCRPSGGTWLSFLPYEIEIYRLIFVIKAFIHFCRPWSETLFNGRPSRSPVPYFPINVIIWWEIYPHHRNSWPGGICLPQKT